MYPFSIESGPKNDPDSRARITFQKIEANVPVNEADFKMPGTTASLSAPSK
jgi:hypothetical protein